MGNHSGQNFSNDSCRIYIFTDVFHRSSLFKKEPNQFVTAIMCTIYNCPVRPAIFRELLNATFNTIIGKDGYNRDWYYGERNRSRECDALGTPEKNTFKYSLIKCGIEDWFQGSKNFGLDQMK